MSFPNVFGSFSLARRRGDERKKERKLILVASFGRSFLLALPPASLAFPAQGTGGVCHPGTRESRTECSTTGGVRFGMRVVFLFARQSMSRGSDGTGAPFFSLNPGTQNSRASSLPFTPLSLSSSSSLARNRATIKNHNRNRRRAHRVRRALHLPRRRVLLRPRAARDGQRAFLERRRADYWPQGDSTVLHEEEEHESEKLEALFVFSFRKRRRDRER